MLTAQLAVVPKYWQSFHTQFVLDGGMRVRIIKRPPASYGTDGESLRVGRIYNLPAGLASALMAEGCAELYDTLPAEARRERAPRDLWQSRDRRAPWSGALPDDDGDPET